MSRNRFVDTNLENMLSDPDIKKYVDSASGEEERKIIMRGVETSLESAYEKYADEYFSTKGLGSYASNFLRYAGAGADLLGTYCFWSFGGAGLGLKFIGLNAKSLADVIDCKHYLEHAGADSLVEKTEDFAALAGESILERAAAYLPLGVGELVDLARGSKKYDNRVLSKALYHAKNDFIKKFGDYMPVEERDVIPLDNFRHPHYADLDGTVLQAA